MSNTGSPVPDDKAQIHSPSLASLRAAHRELLQRHRERGDTPEFLAEVETFILRGRTAGALLDADDDRLASQSLLDYWATMLYRAGREPPDATLADFDPALAPDLVGVTCPYIGLDSFQLEHQSLFFGRQELLDEVVSRIKNERIIAVIGPSGSGKSSLVRAGVLGKLQAGDVAGSREWRYYSPIAPGSEPLSTLADVIRPSGVSRDKWVSLQVKGFRKSRAHLADILSEMNKVPIILVIERFEEVFTLGDGKDTEVLLDNLMYLVQAPDLRHTVILTMRSDHEHFVARFSSFYRLFEKAQVRVTPLGAGELRDAIEKPAAQVGLRFENIIVDALVKDILGEPAGLPLLQFTLLKLWENRDRNRVTWDIYHKLGGARSVLERSADDFYHHLLPEDQLTAKHILLRLVRPSEGLEFTSDRVRRGALYQAEVDREHTDRVLDKLLQARLVRLTKAETAVDDQIELAHEALVRNWRKLVDWLEKEREDRRIRARLTHAAEQWRARGYDPSALIRGSLLDEALSYKDLNDLERRFVYRSRNKIRKNRTVMVSIVSVTIIILATVAVIAGVLWKKATVQGKKATVQAEINELLKSSHAILNSEGDPQLGLLLALHAESIKNSPANNTAQGAVTEVILTAMGAWRLKSKLSFHTDSVLRVAYGPRGLFLATTGADNFVILWAWDSSAGQFIMDRPLLRGPPNTVYGIAFSPDKTDTLLAAGIGNRVLVWKLAPNNTKKQLEIHAGVGKVLDVAFSPDGNRLVAAGTKGRVSVWNLSGEEILRLRAQNKGEVYAVDFSPDGTKLVTAGDDDGIVRVWNALSGNSERLLEGHWGRVRTVAFSPEGTWLATAGDDKTIKVWNARSWTNYKTLLGHSKKVNRIAFSPDGTRLASASSDETVKVWNLSTGQVELTLSGHLSSVESVAFHPEGTQLATASRDKSVRIWDIMPSDQVVSVLSDHKSFVWRITFNPDGTKLATTSSDKTVLVWDTKGSKKPKSLVLGPRSVIEDPFPGISFSSSGDYLAAATDNNMVRVWETKTIRTKSPKFRDLRHPKGHKGQVNGVAFSPKKDWILATGSTDATVKLWNIKSEKVIATFTGHRAPIWDIAFSRDGKWLVSASADRTAIVWDIRDIEDIGYIEKDNGKELVGHDGIVWSVAFSPNGRQVATGSGDLTVKLWDVKSGDMVKMFTGHTGAVGAVAFSSDGTQLASASGDNTVILWDVETGRRMTTLRGHNGPIAGIAFTSEEGKKQLATASLDGTVRLYPLSIRALRIVAQMHVNRFFTQQECQDLLRQKCPETPIKFIARGNKLARKGNFKAAVKAFEEANSLDPSLILDPYIRQAKQLAVHARLSNGRRLAIAGEVDDAIREFKRGRELKDSLKLDPEKYANQLAVPRRVAVLVSAGWKSAKGGKVEAAVASFEKAKDLDPSLKLDPEAEAKRLAAPALSQVR